jgi:hypothetical protein
VVRSPEGFKFQPLTSLSTIVNTFRQHEGRATRRAKLFTIKWKPVHVAVESAFTIRWKHYHHRVSCVAPHGQCIATCFGTALPLA